MRLEDRSAGRWCAECQQHGSHHTDRHAEFAPEPREDVAVAEVLADHMWNGCTNPACDPGRAVDEIPRPFVHHLAEALAPLIAERVREAVEGARDESAVAEVGLTDAEWTRLRHAAGNRGDLGPIAEEFERILGERERAAAVEALREAADDLYAGLGPDFVADSDGVYGDWLRDRADRRAER